MCKYVYMRGSTGVDFGFLEEMMSQENPIMSVWVVWVGVNLG